MTAFDPRIRRALEGFEAEAIPDALPGRLPLLDALRARFPERGAFEDLDVLFIQHHLGPFTVRLAAMRQEGLDGARAWFVDIPYSTCRAAQEAAHEDVPESHTVKLFDDPLEPYAETQLARVLILLQLLAAEKRGRLLVVDDGGYFLRALRLLWATRPELAQRFAGSGLVEQTTRGHRLIEPSKDLIRQMGLAVVSVARCDTKIRFESPFIGAAVSRAIRRALGESSELVEGFRRAAVLGFGPVGEAVAGSLRRAYPSTHLVVVDPDRAKHPRIESTGAVPARELPEHLSAKDRFDLVVGCTGYNSFKLHQRRLLARRAILASGSSAAVEFNRTGFIELADARPDDEIEVGDRTALAGRGIHATITLRHEGGSLLHFLNAGFPVNFDGRMECLPARMIQATHCLLFHAGRQVLRTERPGVHEFDPEVDEWLLHEAPAFLDRSADPE